MYNIRTYSRCRPTCPVGAEETRMTLESLCEEEVALLRQLTLDGKPDRPLLHSPD